MGVTHLNAYSKIADVEVAAVCSDDPRALSGDLSQTGGNLNREIGEHDFSRFRKYTQWRELVVDPELDVVDICLPTDLHVSAAIAALTAGKHVFCEKPMALSAADCDRMIAISEEHNRILMIGQVVRFWPEYRYLESFVKSGEYGAIQSATFVRQCGLPDWSGWLPTEARSGGAVIDLLIHDIDQALLLFGVPDRVAAKKLGDVDALTATLLYSAGPEVRIQGGWFLPGAPLSTSFQVRAERAELQLASRKLRLNDQTGKSNYVDAGGDDAFDSEIAYFVDCCRNGKKPERCLPQDSARAVKLALVAETIESHGRRATQVLGLEDLEIGLVFWAGENARNTLQDVKQFGIRAGQLGFGGELPLEGAAERWDEALTAEHFIAPTAVCSYIGEDYSDIPTVQRTVGLVPAATRKDRVARTKAVSDVAAKLGIDSVACHIGFVPENPDEPLYIEVRDVARDICDHCKANGQCFTLETGQEPAKVLLRFIEDVERSNLKINFDPANMILYGTGDPIEALDVLGKYVISVHCKDGDWPPRDKPEALGVERALGEGSVGIPAFISKLKEIGYRGILSIEREASNPQQRAVDIRKAISLLKDLIRLSQLDGSF